MSYSTHATDIVGYIYQADIYCPHHIVGALVGDAYPVPGQDVEARLDHLAGVQDVDRYDESSYDSGDFPKVVFANMDGADKDRCAACHEPLIGD